MTLKRIGILTAGGDCPGLNAVVRAVSKNALGHGIEVFGIRNGFDGLVRNDIFPLTNEKVSGILTLGGTILGSSNIANPFKYALAPFGTPENPKDVSSVAMHNFKEHELDALITVGGDGTPIKLLGLILLCILLPKPLTVCTLQPNRTTV